MESLPPPDAQVQSPSGTPSQPQTQPTVAPGRDPDLVALEGFEAEFADLEVELERVERTSGDRGSAPPES